MPYIKQEDRPDFDGVVEKFEKVLAYHDVKVGEVNYLITRLIHAWILKCGMCYSIVNSAIGIIECVKLELYRMVAGPYEDQKKEENGFISNLDS